MDNNFNPQVPQQVPGKGLAIASLVCGIVAVASCFFGIYAAAGIVLGIVGIVLSVMAKKQIPAGAPKGAATAGLVLSIIALAICTIVFIACMTCYAAVNSALNQLGY